MTYYRGTGEMYIGGIKSHKYNDNRCLTDRGEKKTEPGLFNCKEAMQKGMGIYWDFTQVRLQNQFRLTALFKRELLSFIVFDPFLNFVPGKRAEEPSDEALPGDGEQGSGDPGMHRPAVEDPKPH